MSRSGRGRCAEGFWLFLATEKGQPTREQVEEWVWQRVAYLEVMGSVMDTFMDEVSSTPGVGLSGNPGPRAGGFGTVLARVAR